MGWAWLTYFLVPANFSCTPNLIQCGCHQHLPDYKNPDLTSCSLPFSRSPLAITCGSRLLIPKSCNFSAVVKSPIVLYFVAQPASSALAPPHPAFVSEGHPVRPVRLDIMPPFSACYSEKSESLIINKSVNFNSVCVHLISLKINIPLYFKGGIFVGKAMLMF